MCRDNKCTTEHNCLLADQNLTRMSQQPEDLHLAGNQVTTPFKNHQPVLEDLYLAGDHAASSHSRQALLSTCFLAMTGDCLGTGGRCAACPFPGGGLSPCWALIWRWGTLTSRSLSLPCLARHLTTLVCFTTQSMLTCTALQTQNWDSGTPSRYLANN